MAGYFMPQFAGSLGGPSLAGGMSANPFNFYPQLAGFQPGLGYGSGASAGPGPSVPPGSMGPPTSPGGFLAGGLPGGPSLGGSGGGVWGGGNVTPGPAITAAGGSGGANAPTLANPENVGRDQWGRRIPTDWARSPIGEGYQPTPNPGGNAMNPWAYGMDAQGALAQSPWTGYFNQMAQGGVPGMPAMNSYSLPQGWDRAGISERVGAYRQAYADQAAARAADQEAAARSGERAAGTGAVAGGLGAAAGLTPWTAAAAGVGAGAGWLGNRFGWW